MKLIASNFKGNLPNGNMYKIEWKCTQKTKDFDFFETRYIHLSLKEYHPILEMYHTKESLIVSYKNNYKKALKKILIEAENKWNIQLLKAELKLAV